MYIVAIGWAYVILMMAVTSSSVGKALAIVLLLGVAPIALFVYAVGGRKRGASVRVVDEVADERDTRDSHSD